MWLLRERRLFFGVSFTFPFLKSALLKKFGVLHG